MLSIYDNIKVEVSNRHVHLSEEDFYELFGSYEMVFDRKLSVANEFAAKHWVTVKTDKGQIERVRVLGPCRVQTQVELINEDQKTLNLRIPKRLSGDINRTPGATLIGTKGKVKLKKGLIRSIRHIHVNKNNKMYTLPISNAVVVTLNHKDNNKHNWKLKNKNNFW